MKRMEAKVYMKLHSAQGQMVLAACDIEVLGRTLSTGEVDFFISNGFYRGEKVSLPHFIEMAKRIGNVNVVGRFCVEGLIKAGLIDIGSVIYLEGIPHCQIYDVRRL